MRSEGPTPKGFTQPFMNPNSERALKERHLKGQSDRAVIFRDIGRMRSEGPTPINLTNPIHTFHPTLCRRLSEIHETPPRIPYSYDALSGF